MLRRLRFGFIAFTASVTCFALVIQFAYFLMWAEKHDMGTLYGIWNYFSYFTNLSNVFAALALIFAVKSHPNRDLLLQKASPITGVAVLLLMTCLVYNFMLQQQYHSSGLSLVADILLHDVSPALFIVFWWFFVPRKQLQFTDTLKWMLFPIGYFCYVLVRGHYLGHYPYPFLNAAKYGYMSVIENGLGMLAGFLSLSLLFVAGDRFKPKAAG